MTVVEISNGILTGLTADTKPTTYPAGTIYLDTQTGAIWMYLVSTWTAVGGLGTPVSVPNGGTGATTLTGILKGNGTSAITAAALLAVADGGTGAGTLTGIVKGNGTGAFTASNTLTGITLTAPVIDSIVSGDVGIDFSNSPYTVPATKTFIRVDASAGSPSANTILTLPTAVGIAGVKYTIKRTDIIASSFLAQINTTSSQTIDGAPAHYLWPAEFVELESDGANWFITNRTQPSATGYYMLKGSTPDRRYGAGNFGIQGTYQTSTTSPATGTLWAFPFIVAKTTKFDTISFQMTTGSGGTNAHLGIYRDTGNCYPGERMYDSGDIDCTTPGVMSKTITAGIQVFPVGLYWLAWEVSAATIQVHILGATPAQTGFLGKTPGTTGNGYYYSVAHTFGALPDPYTTAATVGSGNSTVGAPLIAINMRPI